MSEATFTPGPWKWEYGILLGADKDEHIIWPYNVSAHNVSGGDNKTAVAQLGSYGQHAEAHAKENMSLIAAAPELYGAIVELLKGGEHEGECDEGYLGLSSSWERGPCVKHLAASEKREEEARKVLAKAREESQ